MREQPEIFEMTVPTRSVKQYGRKVEPVDYRMVVTSPTRRDTVASFIACLGILLGATVWINWYLYNDVSPQTLFYPPALFYCAVGASVCASIVYMARHDAYYKMYMSVTGKHQPTMESVEYAVKPVGATIAPRRNLNVNGVDEQYEPEPRDLEYRGLKYTLTREQIKELRSRYVAGDVWIRKQQSGGYLGVDSIKINASTYTRFLQILKGLGYVEDDGVKNKVTDLWVVEVLQLPPPRNDNNE